MSIIIDPRYFIVVGGDTYLIDYLRQPTWDLENKIPIFNEIYKRVNPSDKSINNPYIIRKQLEMGSKEDLFHFYHPYIPFDVENSKASSWLSWCNVQIPGESGVLGKEETVQLLRVRSGTDMKDFSRKSMNDMLVIDAPFPSDSVMNWNNWLKHAETLPQEVSSSKVVKDEVTSVISSLSSALISSQQVLSHLNSLVGFMEFQGIEKNGRVIQNINMGNRQKKISKGDGQEVSTYDVKNYDVSENAFTQAGYISQNQNERMIKNMKPIPTNSDCSSSTITRKSSNFGRHAHNVLYDKRMSICKANNSELSLKMPLLPDISNACHSHSNAVVNNLDSILQNSFQRDQKAMKKRRIQEKTDPRSHLVHNGMN